MKHEDTITETKQGTILIIKYNRPHKKNAIDSDMYLRVTSIINTAAKDDDVSLVVLTGTGDYFSSGNDFVSSTTSGVNTLANILQEFIDAFITFPKLLVAIVNGPAIGIAATTLALCDLVFASENSFFYTPFTKLGLVSEGCSTFTFPRLMGNRKAAEMLLYNHKMSAEEALNCGFINHIYKPEELQSKVWDKIVEVSELPKHSISASKRLIRGAIHNELLKTNAREIKELKDILAHREELLNVFSFKKNKSKI